MKFENNIENCIEFLNGQDTMTASFCWKKYINKIKRLAKKRPNEVIILAENEDGSICVKLPMKYLKISPPREVSEEQREASGERLKQYRESKTN